jgi:hypothetical protein
LGCLDGKPDSSSSGLSWMESMALLGSKNESLSHLDDGHTGAAVYHRGRALQSLETLGIVARVSGNPYHDDRGFPPAKHLA